MIRRRVAHQSRCWARRAPGAMIPAISFNACASALGPSAYAGGEARAGDGGKARVYRNAEDFYDLCARGGIDLVFLGCAQIDAEGRTNVSAIGSWHDPKVRLPGGGGAAVMMPTAKRVATWRTEHSPRTLVDKLDFVTASGNMAAVVTPIAVFQRGRGRLALESWNPQVTLDEVVKRTGFKFDATGTQATLPITEREHAALSSLDPQGEFAAELNA